MHRVLSALALTAALALAGVASAQQCPMGSYRSIDNWGNSVCKRMSDQSTESAERPRYQACPMGSYQTVDNYGNQICRTFEASNQPRTDYYDTSRGCPVGFYQGVDNYGRPACKRF